MSQGAWVLVVALALAAAFGLYRAYADGRFRGTHPVRGSGAGGPGGTGLPPTDAEREDGTAPGGVLVGSELAAAPLGERATLLQFSSAFCAPCRATRRILADVADLVPGVVHLEVDAEHHLDLVRRVGILRTPTTLILGADGQEISRASGAPRKEAVLATLAEALDGGDDPRG